MSTLNAYSSGLPVVVAPGWVLSVNGWTVHMLYEIRVLNNEVSS